MTTIPTHRSTDHRWLGELFLVFLAYWVFVLLGLAIVAAVALAPEYITNRWWATQYELQSHRNQALARRIEQMRNQIAALADDPQFTERVIRRELNLRDPSEEVLVVGPAPAGMIEDRIALPAGVDGGGSHLIRVFSDPARRRWLLPLGLGLIASGMIVATGHRIRLATRTDTG